MSALTICAHVSIDGTGKIPVYVFRLDEALFEIPRYSVEIAAEQDPLETYLGKDVVISPVELQSGQGDTPRTFAGIVTEAELVTEDGGLQMIRLTVRPPVAVLGLSRSSAVYLNKTSVDIFEEVLKRNGLERYRVVASALSTQREICIQYNENDLDFVRRLLAEDGFTFYFHDGQTAATILLHDVSKPFPASKDAAAKTALKLTDAGTPDATRERAEGLNLTRLVTAGKVSLTNYDDAKATATTKGPKTSTKVKMTAKPAITEYRAAPNGAIGGPPLDIAANQTAAAQARLTGTVRNSNLYLGRELDVASSRNSAMPGAYIVTAITYLPGTGEGHTCEFAAVPKDLPPYPARLEKPLIHSVHNAVVVGGNAGDPACDAEGRVKVKFFWDTSSETKNTSCPIRVAETYAGNGYGGQFIPRSGHEVLVSFLHGDPDAPVITGQIYNGKAKHPFMAANTTKSGVTSKLKGKSNELEFDDKGGSELVALRAAKDYSLEVTEASKRDVKKTEDTKIGEGATLDVGKNYAVTVKDKASVAAATMAVDIQKSSTHDAQTIEMTAKSKITLKVGGSKIEMTSTDIKITAPNVTVAAKANLKLEGLKVDAKAKTQMALKGLQVQVNGSVKAEVKGGAMAEVKGGGMLTLKGGVAMIN